MPVQGLARDTGGHTFGSGIQLARRHRGLQAIPVSMDSPAFPRNTPQPPNNSNHASWQFNFESAPWQMVIRNLAERFGLSVQFLTVPEGSFSYYDATPHAISEAIDILNDHLLSQGYIIVRNRMNLTVTSSSSQLPDSIVPFVGLASVESLGRNELASVAFPLTNPDVQQAVQEVASLLSPLGQVKPLSNSSRLIVTDTGNYLRRVRDLLFGAGIARDTVETVVYHVGHASAEEVATSINTFLTGQAARQSGDDGSVSNAAQRVVAENTTNSLLIRGDTQEMESILQLVRELDRGPRQVLVQALLVEVQLGNTHEFGVELGFQDSVLFDRSVIDNIITIAETTTSPLGVSTTNEKIISQTAAPGFNFNNRAPGNNTAVQPGTIGKQSLTQFGVGRVNGDLGYGGLVLSAGSESVNVLLRALDANFDIDVLSRPQVRTVENHEATIQIGQQVPVVDGVTVTGIGAANPVIRQDQAGIILRVTPRISPTGRILVDVNAEKSSYQFAPGTGVPIFTDATNGNVIEAPVKDVTTAKTAVSVQSGQTIVLGGMITNENATVVKKVPWLGDLPWIGRAFRYDLHDTSRKELLILLTPVLVEGDAGDAELTQREINRVHMPMSAWEFGENVPRPTAVSPHNTNLSQQHLPMPPVQPSPMQGQSAGQRYGGVQGHGGVQGQVGVQGQGGVQGWQQMPSHRPPSFSRYPATR